MAPTRHKLGAVEVLSLVGDRANLGYNLVGDTIHIDIGENSIYEKRQKKVIVTIKGTGFMVISMRDPQRLPQTPYRGRMGGKWRRIGMDVPLNHDPMYCTRLYEGMGCWAYGLGSFYWCEVRGDSIQCEKVSDNIVDSLLRR